ncbi:MAG TPA: histidine phosphatase family protein [Gammaproteobacteria bacterium]|nr:histidine phosphatase family protein [Gammaproteobacteria bacterium]
MQLYLMRHGETNYNVMGLCNDDPGDPVYLTERGRQQALETAQQLKDTPIGRIAVSELPRTAQTADIINACHHAPVSVRPELNDIRTGFNGRPVREFHQALADSPLDAKAPGGESIREHKARVLKVLQWLDALSEPQVLLVSHEEPLRVLIAHFRGLDDRDMMALNIGNCEILSFRR